MRHEESHLLPRASSVYTSSCLARYSIGDWLVTLVLVVLGLWADGWPPIERDIKPQLHDSAISYPFTPNDLQQVPSKLLWRLSVFLPLLLVTFLAVRPPRSMPATRLLNELCLGLISSVAMAFLFTCVVKCLVGRLRPDFIARCNPVHGACTGDPRIVTEGRKSFPSGHSTLVFSGLGFASLAYGARLADVDSPRLGTLWKGLVAILPWSLALWVGLSRISDYWHHWSDVLVGSAIGHVGAWLGFRMRFPSPWAAGVAGSRLVPHAMRSEEWRKDHGSPPAVSV